MVQHQAAMVCQEYIIQGIHWCLLSRYLDVSVVYGPVQARPSCLRVLRVYICMVVQQNLQYL